MQRDGDPDMSGLFTAIIMDACRWRTSRQPAPGEISIELGAVVTPCRPVFPSANPLKCEKIDLAAPHG